MLLGKGSDVVLEGVGHPAVADPHIADTLQGVPEVISLAHSPINQLIKVEVVAENDVTPHVKQEALWCKVCAGKATCLIRLQHAWR